MSEVSRCVAVTGASGFVGRHLCDFLGARGARVLALVRDPLRYPFHEKGIEVRRCNLPEVIDRAAIHEADAVVHCAYASRATNVAEAERVNWEGTARVYEVARRAGVRKFVFLSSTSAHEEALSYYGRSKLAIEGRLDLERDVILRSGLVLAHGDEGLFPRMVAALRRTHLVPVVGGGRQILQTVHVDDLCQAIERALASECAGRYVVAEPEGLPFRDFFRLVAERLGIQCWFFPLPTRPILPLLRTVERLGISLPISSENVLGLQALRFVPSAADLARLGVRARPARESLEAVFGPNPG